MSGRALSLFLLLAVLAALCFAPGQAGAQQETRRVLFIGNSYTFRNDLPKMLEQVAASAGGETRAYKAEMIAKAAETLAGHANDQALPRKIQAGHFDYVILQEQSTTPLYSDEAQNSLDSFRYLAALAIQAGSMPVIYGTWPRRENDALYAQPAAGNFIPPQGPEDMLSRLHGHFETAAKISGAVYAPVGVYWQHIVRNYPRIILYDADGSHPNQAGSYLAALVLYRTLSGRSPETVAWKPSSVNEKDAQMIRRVAAQ